MAGCRPTSFGAANAHSCHNPRWRELLELFLVCVDRDYALKPPSIVCIEPVIIAAWVPQGTLQSRRFRRREPGA